MHKWFDLKSLKKQPYKKLYTLKNKTNFKRYIPFKYCVNQYFLLDKSDFNSYPISYKVYRGLWDNTINSIDSENKTELIKINAII